MSLPLKPPLWCPGIEPPPNLIFCTSMQEAEGDVVRDAVGGLSGAFVGPPAWGAGEHGPCLEFTTDHVNFGDISLFDGLTEVSFEAMVYATANQTHAIITKYNSQANPNDRSFLFRISVGAAYPKLQVMFLDGPYEYVQWVTDNDAVTLNEWHHVAVCADIPGQTCGLYVDGVAVAATKATAGTPPTSIYAGPVPVWIGAQTNVGGPGGYFAGRISQVAAWDQQLTAGEVARRSFDPWQFIQPPSLLPLFSAAVQGGGAANPLLKMQRCQVI